jgi:hypothetical protein
LKIKGRVKLNVLNGGPTLGLWMLFGGWAGASAFRAEVERQGEWVETERRGSQLTLERGQRKTEHRMLERIGLRTLLTVCQLLIT